MSTDKRMKLAHDCALQVFADEDVADPRAPEAADAGAVAWQYRWRQSGNRWSDWVNLTEEAYATLGEIVDVPYEGRKLYASPTAAGIAAPPAASADAVRANEDMLERANDLADEIMSQELMWMTSGFFLSDDDSILIGEALRSYALTAPVAGE